MSNETPSTRTLQRALETSGSVKSLAALLNTTVVQLEDWLSGKAMPLAAYMAALDIVAHGRPRSR